MKNNALFKSFDYVVRNLSIYENKVEVKVFFIFKDKNVITKSLFIKKLNDKTDAYYLNEAKKIIEKMIKNGSLKKECEKKVKRKKLLPISIPIVSAMAVTGITLGCYYGLKSSNEVKVIDPEINGLVIEKQTAIIGQDFDTKILIDTDLVDNYILPKTLSEVKSGDDILDASCYTYEVNSDYLSATLHIPSEYIKGDISIKLTLDEMPWYLNKKYINGLTKEDVTKEGGEIQTLKVNGLDHKVRLIGVDEDCADITKPDETKIHTTWEFANLISDSNGYSLATQWNDTNETSTANCNYLDSSVRMALVGEKQELGHILWAQKEATTWSNDYKCSVLDMLNEGNSGFGDALKAPSKYINIWNDEKQPEAGWDEETVNDKLFLLSPKEMGRDSGGEAKTTVYSYYDGATDTKRIKKQIKGDERYASSSEIPSVESQTYGDSVDNYAGYNSETDATGGGYYWLRSPNTNQKKLAWRVTYDGQIGNRAYVYDRTHGVVPAFCI